jgi:uncharacterized protein with FMN-binding domain
MKSKTRRVVISVGVIAVLLALMLVGATSGMGEIRKLTIDNVDLTTIADGAYRGSYHKGRWVYDVEVTVVNHKITSVKNTNPKTNMAKALCDGVAASVIQKQSPRIDAVCGASISTKAFAKAVENALVSGRR